MFVRRRVILFTRKPVLVVLWFPWFQICFGHAPAAVTAILFNTTAFFCCLLRSYAGQVGYIIAGMKDVKEAQIGDTLHLQEQPVEALPGFKPAKAMVFAG